jgi:hypothetical protein
MLARRPDVGDMDARLPLRPEVVSMPRPADSRMVGMMMIFAGIAMVVGLPAPWTMPAAESIYECPDSRIC